MEDLYEVTVTLKNDDDLLSIDHRFATLPGRETVKALLDEGMVWFSSLYGEEAEERKVWLVRRDRDETLDAVSTRV